MPSPLIIANVLAPYVAWGVGDDTSLSLPFSMLATTLAAVVERPFVRAAGIDQSSFRYSMRANILSWLVGLLIAYGSLIMRMETIFFLMYFFAIPFSIAVEGWYLSTSTKIRHPTKLKWPPIIIGNIVSGVLLFAIIFIGFESGDRLQRTGSPFVLFLTEHGQIMHVAVLLSCALLFLFFCLPKLGQAETKQKSGEMKHVDPLHDNAT